MDTSAEDMRLMIQEWFAQASDYHMLGEIYYAIRAESEKQHEFMAKVLAKIKDSE